MLAILQDLHHEDHFGLIQFSNTNTILQWKNSLMKATRENVTNAMEYVKRIRDSGSEIQTENIKSVTRLGRLHNFNFNSFFLIHKKRKNDMTCPDRSPLTGTDINGAVLRAVDMLKREKGGTQTSVDMIILLTDGMPNSGEFMRIYAHMKTGIILQSQTETRINCDILEVWNSFVHIFCLGVQQQGYKVQV